MMLYPRIRGPFMPEKEVKVMKTDIKKEDGDFVLEMELPGFTKDEISITLKEGYMTVAASKEEEEKSEEDYVRCERFKGSWKRAFYVGESLTENDIKADFKDGILTVRFPMQKEEDVKKIEIS